MFQFVKNNIYIAIIVLYFGILLYCSPLDITQVNWGDKCVGFLLDSTRLNLTGSYPLYSFLCWLIGFGPFDSAFGINLFLSIIPAIVSIFLVYQIIKLETNNILYSLTGMSVLMSSSLYFLQAQKLETYVLAGLLLLAGLYLVLKRHFNISAVILSFACLCHPMSLFFLAPFLIHYSEIRKRIWIVCVICAIFIINWYFIPNPSINATFFNNRINWDFIVEKTGGLLSGLILFFSLGFIPACYLLFKRQDFYFTFIIWIFAFSLKEVFVTNVGWNQIAIALPIFAVASGIGIRYINNKKIILGGCLSMLIVCIFFFNIRAIDNVDNHTTARKLLNSLMSMTEYSELYVFPIYKDNVVGGQIILDSIKYCEQQGRKIKSTYYLVDKVYYVDIINEKNFDFVMRLK